MPRRWITRCEGYADVFITRRAGSPDPAAIFGSIKFRRGQGTPLGGPCLVVPLGIALGFEHSGRVTRADFIVWPTGICAEPGSADSVVIRERTAVRHYRNIYPNCSFNLFISSLSFAASSNSWALARRRISFSRREMRFSIS
jgi:hypothetical protein